MTDTKSSTLSQNYIRENASKFSVLVVDDTPENLRLMTQMLSDQGYKVRAAIDGIRALASVEATPPDLILLDVMMPKLDGYEVCQRLKANKETHHIPIIFISALNTTEDKVKAFEVGGVDYITKPLQVREILARVATHLALGDLQKSLQQELNQRETLIGQLDTMNSQLQHEVAERRHVEVALELSREHFRTVADFTYNWEYWIGPGGYPVYISPSCERITGYRREEFQKDPGLLASIVHPEDRKMWIEHLNTIMRETVEVESFQFRILTREGEWRWLAHSCQPVYRSDGTWAGRRASNRDITERVNAEMQLKQYALDLEAQNAELDAFAHTVAHDLKTPLASLIGFSQLLSGRFGRMDEDQTLEMLTYIGQNAQKMASIIDELLLLASVRKLEDIDIQPLHMESIVNEAQARLVGMADEYKAMYVLPKAWPEIVGYAPWIEEVWVNYISNAMKYGGRPKQNIPPRVELGYDTPIASCTMPPHCAEGLPLPTETSHIRFWVRDNGPGLNEEECAQLFTQFTRLHQRSAAGHGLGLSIVRRIVEKLGGSVGVESEKDQGSTFWFTLPTTE